MMILDAMQSGDTSFDPDPDVLLAVDFSVGSADLSSYQSALTVSGDGTITGGEFVTDTDDDNLIYTCPQIHDHPGEAFTLETRWTWVSSSGGGSEKQHVIVDFSDIISVSGHRHILGAYRSNDHPPADGTIRYNDHAGSGTVTTDGVAPTDGNTSCHVAIVCPAGLDQTGRIYLDGVMVGTATVQEIVAVLPANATYLFTIGPAMTGSWSVVFKYNWAMLRLGEHYTGNDTVTPNFTPPVNMPSIFL